jgi:SWI/SNF-related matrix-associated actin-dependent regulator 1 of chromatin subfamily A
MTISLTQEGKIWIVRSAFADKDIVKAAGARWNPDRKCWWTDKPEVAEKLAQGDAAAVAAINAERQAAHERAQRAVDASRATDAAIDLPVPEGLAYKPYQRAGIAFALDRPHVLFGDEMGLGKTIQAVGVINADPSIKSVLIVCPAGIKLNWAREVRKWLVRPMSVGLATSAGLPEADVVIVNYDILLKLADAVRARAWDMACLDECHYAKNKKAQRTQALFGKWDKGARRWAIEPLKPRRWIAMTGTPILNRPSELWTLVHAFDRNGLGKNWMDFHVRYCAGQHGEYGFQADGASNLAELNTKLRSSFMVRRLKKDVLTDLPPKVRQVIVLEPTAKALALIKRESALVERVTKARTLVGAASADENAYQAAVKALEDATDAAFAEMSAIRHEIALAKLPQVIEHVRDVLEGGVEKVVVWAHHRDVVEGLRDALAEFAPVAIYGDMTPAQAQGAVDHFQDVATCRVAVCSIKKAGVGFTMTAASHEVFAERDWTPGWVNQAEDRCHRIGQRESVLIQHIVLDGSLDAGMTQMMVAKQEVADAALDGEGKPLQAPKLLDAPVPAPEKPVQAPPAPGVDDLSGQQVQAVHDALRVIAGLCDGAQVLDGMGFNKLDTDFGHDLASRSSLSQKQALYGKKLVVKYQRQIPAELLAVVKGGAQ